MKVFLVSCGDSLHGMKVAGVYRSVGRAIKSIRIYADEHGKCYGRVGLIARYKGSRTWREIHGPFMTNIVEREII